MEDELERIKHVSDMYQKDEDKIAFLLRQIEWLLQSRNAYKEQALKNK